MVFVSTEALFNQRYGTEISTKIQRSVYITSHTICA